MVDFLAGLRGQLAKQAPKMLALLELVAEEGIPRNREASHKIEGEIWEFIRGDLRIFWFYDTGKVIVLCHGFVKKSQKTPKREIRNAQNELQRYLIAKQVGRLKIEEEQ